MEIQINDTYKLDGHIYKVITVYEMYSQVEYIENDKKFTRPINNSYLKTGQKL